MEYLHEQSIIAVSFEGVEVGREGKLAWIPVSSPVSCICFYM